MRTRVRRRRTGNMVRHEKRLLIPELRARRACAPVVARGMAQRAARTARRGALRAARVRSAIDEPYNARAAAYARSGYRRGYGTAPRAQLCET